LKLRLKIEQTTGNGVLEGEESTAIGLMGMFRKPETEALLLRN
jgi:hypothetical protein